MPRLDLAAEVERVDVIRIAPDVWRSLRESWSSIPGRVLGETTGAEAAALWTLFVNLPDGEQMRCFVPAYGLRAYGDGHVLAEAAICFKCNNGVTSIDGRKDSFKFDSTSQAAQDLLVRLRTLDADPPVDS